MSYTTARSDVGEVPTQMPPHIRSQFLNEFSLAGRLLHPHIAAILDAHADEESSYVVSEYVAGGSLHNLTASGKLVSTADVIEIGFKCCGALDYAFRNHIVHRDIKPANILVAGGTDIKIADLGAAFIRNANTTQVLDIGSASYVSSEQAKASELTHRGDMFSLAVMLYELSTGKRPFTGTSPGEIVRSIVFSDPQQLSGSAPTFRASSMKFRCAHSGRNRMIGTRAGRIAPRRLPAWGA